MTQQLIGVGLVGVGRFARFLTESMVGLEHYRLAAVARGRDPASADELATKLGADVVDGLDELLARSDVQAVIIASPPAAHADQLRAVIAAGRHALCEKPHCTSLTDADELAAATARAGVVVTVNYVMRHNPLYALLQRLQRARVEDRDLLGPLTHYCLRNFASVDGLDPQHWFWDPSISGGILVEHGVHFFDIYRQLAGGPPSAVVGTRLSTPGGVGPHDVMTASVVGPGGTSGTFMHSFTKRGTGGTGQYCDVSIDWRHARADLTGWLPVTMDLMVTGSAGAEVIGEVVPDGRALAALAGLEPNGSEWVTIDQTSDENGQPAVRVRASAGQKAAVYRASVRAVMADFLAAIRGERSVAIPLARATGSVADALAATASARSSGS